MTANGVYAMSAVTALTAQNTTGVTDILEATPAFLAAELDAVFTDIFPDAIKIGMVSSRDLIAVITEKLVQYGAKHVVVDPVMVATSGAKLLREDAIDTLKQRLLPLAEVVTPNIPEAEILSGMKIVSPTDMETAARIIHEQYGCAVLCKGGHDLNDANDLLWKDGSGHWFQGRRINNPNTHGTGCTLSSAIASNLAKGMELSQAVERAKAYISGALAAMLDLGSGRGPMDHLFDLQSQFLN
jgi:hydroxymethylpyrimidine/phosphomethylpyrimidine kinase